MSEARFPEKIALHRTYSGNFVLPEDRRCVEPLNAETYIPEYKLTAALEAWNAKRERCDRAEERERRLVVALGFCTEALDFAVSAEPRDALKLRAAVKEARTRVAELLEARVSTGGEGE